MRALLVSLVVLVVVALAGALLAPWLVDADVYRAEIVHRVAAAMGRPVAVTGPIAVTVLPSPRVRASDVRIGGASDGSTETIEAKHVEVAIGWTSLFGGAIELTHLRLVEPVLVIDTQSEKWRYWTAFDAGETGALRIEHLEIESGRVVWRRENGAIRTLEQIQAAVSTPPGTDALRATGTAVAEGIPLEFEAALGDAPARRPRALNASVALRPGLARATFRGTYFRPDAAAPPELRGRFHLEGGQLAAAFAAIAPGWIPGGPLAPAIAQDFAADADLHVVGESLNCREVSVRVGEVRAAGTLNARFVATPVLDLALSMTWLDLDRLAQAPRSRGVVDRAERRGASSGVVSRLARVETAPRLGMPRNLDGSLELTIEALGVNGGVIRQAKLNAALSGGDVVVNQATAQLPGGAVLNASGQIGRAAAPAGDDSPRVEGTLSLEADNLRGLLNWIGIDTSAVPTDRLRRYFGRANVRGTLRRLEFTELDMRIDSSRLTGGIALVPSPRPGLGIELRLDQMNIDGYFGAAAPGERPPAPASSRAIGLSPALLNSFDATVRLRADALSIGGVPMTEAALDGILQNGSLDIRQFSVADIFGARVSTSGRIAELAQSPNATLDVEVHTADSSRLLRLADLAPAAAGATLDLAGRVVARFGESIVMEDVALTYTGAAFHGRARYDVDSSRLRLDLVADEVPLDALPMPTATSAAPGLNLEVSLAAKRISASGPALEDTRLDAGFHGGSITAATLTGTLYGGNLTFSARAADAAGLSGTLTLIKGDLRQALASLVGTESVSGRIDLRATLSSPTRAIAELRGRLAGVVELDGQGGTIDGVDLAAMRALMQKDVPVDIVSLLGAGLKGGGTPYRALGGTAKIEGGVLSTDDLRIATESGAVTARGVVDLNRRTLDAVLSLPVSPATDVPPLRIGLRGGIDDPHVAVDFTELQKYLLQRGATARP